jgi:hypothetical protein
VAGASDSSAVDCTPVPSDSTRKGRPPSRTRVDVQTRADTDVGADAGSGHRVASTATAVEPVGPAGGADPERRRTAGRVGRRAIMVAGVKW